MAAGKLTQVHGVALASTEPTPGYTFPSHKNSYWESGKLIGLTQLSNYLFVCTQWVVYLQVELRPSVALSGFREVTDAYPLPSLF